MRGSLPAAFDDEINPSSPNSAILLSSWSISFSSLFMFSGLHLNVLVYFDHCHQPLFQQQQAAVLNEKALTNLYVHYQSKTKLQTGIICY